MACSLRLLRSREYPGAALICGKKSARATLTSARACWKRATAPASSWFLAVARFSRRFSSSSAKICHHAPFGRWADGSAVFHCADEELNRLENLATAGNQELAGAVARFQ